MSLALFKNSAYDGVLDQNPFNFGHFNFPKLNLMVDGHASLWEISRNDLAPKQSGDIDCSVFACQYAKYFGLNKTFDFFKDNIAHKRTEMSKEILSFEISLDKTQIDLLLHNGDLVSETDVIECPFSDHHFVVAKLDIPKSPNIFKKIECRNLSSVNILKINLLIEEIDFQQIRNYDDINEKWIYVKNKITEIIDYVLPLRKITVKNMNQFP
ncbi:unnamed protein product [Brachionus calyciflorus]|uniref:Ubiquitin-like protease family profile domain-containing protein n=1 Tax=Brachionus calyciflorus TaxID=104777 RepID=A0A813Z1G0_9BILA|nr:unnamed protein product [Brachionus calyciflorus]